MTAGAAVAAIFRLTKPYGHIPIPEGHGHPHVFGQSARVSFVAKPAGSSFLDLIDMNKMKITVSIPKSSHRCCALFRHQGGLMATETEIVFRFLEGNVKPLWVFIGQEAEIGGTVRLVAS